jgi:hypothetical protein
MIRWITRTVQRIGLDTFFFFSDLTLPWLGAETFYLTVTIIQPGPDNFLETLKENPGAVRLELERG